MPCRLRREPLRAGAAFIRVNSLTSLLRKRCLLRPPSSPPHLKKTNPILSGSFSFRSKTHTHKREMSRRVKTFYLIYTRLKYKSNIRSYYGFILSYLFSTCQVSNVHNRGHLKRFSFQFKGSHVKLIICSFFSNQLFEFLLYDNTPFIIIF